MGSLQLGFTRCYWDWLCWVGFVAAGLGLPLLGFIRRCWALTRCCLVAFALAALNSPSLAHLLTLVALDSPSLTLLASVGFNPLQLGLLDVISIVSAWRRWRNSVRWKKMTRQKTGQDFRRDLFFMTHRWISYFVPPRITSYPDAFPSPGYLGP